MNLQDVQFLYNYNYWARDRLLDKARGLTTQQYLALTTFDHGSIRNILVHTLSAEWIWRMRCQERRSPSQMLAFDDFPSIDSLQQKWREEELQMRAFLQGSASDELSQVIHYQRTGGEPRQNVLWHLLVHVVNHGTEHRAQVAAALTAYGCSPGDIDIVHYLRETG